MTGLYHRLGLPVTATDREIVAAVRRRLKQSALGRDRRDARHETYRAVLACHHEARQVYSDWRF